MERDVTDARGAQRFVGSFLDCADWLDRKTPITWILLSIIVSSLCFFG